jgi:hypothetical protein
MSVNMKNLKNKKASQERKERKNAALENDALSDPDVLFGKAIKTMGDGMFRVQLPNPKRRVELIEVTAKAVDKNMARIAVNDIVIVVQSGTLYEVKGNVSARNIKTLITSKRLHHSLIDGGSGAADDGIDFVFEAPNEADEDEIDLDAI